MTHAIVDGADLAIRDKIKDERGNYSHKKWILELSNRQAATGRLDTKFTGKVDHEAKAVEAYIGSGKWSAMCPVCGPAATEYVNPVDAVFYCFNCGNREVGGAGRHVIFPDDQTRIQIETLLLERPMDNRRGPNLIAQAGQAEGIIPNYFREWGPAVSIETLLEENARIRPEMKNKVGQPEVVGPDRRPVILGQPERFTDRTAKVYPELIFSHEAKRLRK